MRKTILMLAIAGALAGMNTPALAAGTKIGGKIYSDFTNKINKNEATGAQSADSGTGADVKRFYIIVNHDFDKVWSAGFVTDMGDQNGKYDVFVKKAFLQAKFMPEAVVRLGVADMPWIPFDEDLYGYRYVENTLIDRLGYGTSADYGVHFLGNAAGGMVNYAVSAVNGNGYSKPARSKSPSYEGRIGVQPIKGLNFAIGGYTGTLGQSVNGGPAIQHIANRFDAIAAYTNDMFRVGAEYFRANNWKNVTTVAEDAANGYSFWAAADATKEIAFFGRYDHASPSRNLNPDLKDKYFNLGVQYKPNKAVNVALVYKGERVDSGKGGTIGTSNGVIGSATPNSSGSYREIGVWTQFAF